MLQPLEYYLQLFTLENIWNGFISILQWYYIIPR